jgi:hypothetical protein
METGSATMTMPESSAIISCSSVTALAVSGKCTPGNGRSAKRSTTRPDRRRGGAAHPSDLDGIPRDLDTIALKLTMIKLAMEMAFRPNDELDATLKRLAAKQGKSVSQVVRELIEAGLAQQLREAASAAV